MILADVEYINGNGQPPPELQKVLRWRTWGALPRGPSIDEQRYGELEKMLASANAYDVWKKHKDGNLKDMTKAQTKLLRGLKGLLNGR